MCIQLNERHHAWIVSDFYGELMKHYGDMGIQVFRKASQTYGEERGRRMAYRALRDKKDLSFETYFAYGEYLSTSDFFEVEMKSKEGVVEERVTRCPWAEIFHKKNLKECGVVYCREIDRAIVRGFNPNLQMDTISTQHESHCCQFYFRDSSLHSNTLDRADAYGVENEKRLVEDMNYHCAHVFKVLDQIISSVFGLDAEHIKIAVEESFVDEYGVDSFKEIKKRLGIDFTVLDRSLKLEEDKNAEDNGI